MMNDFLFAPLPKPPSDWTTADRINRLELLYQTLFNLTGKAEEKSIELDKQLAIEETRASILEESGQIIGEISSALLGLGDRLDSDLVVFEKAKESLVLLASQIELIDQQRLLLCKEERLAVQQMLVQMKRGQQAVTKYQQFLPIDEIS